MHEPLLIRNIDKLIAYIREKWPKCKSNNHLVSNLSVISHNPEILNKLHRVGIRSIQFSFYGTEEVHDYFAGRQGATKTSKKQSLSCQKKALNLHRLFGYIVK